MNSRRFEERSIESLQECNLDAPDLDVFGQKIVNIFPLLDPDLSFEEALELHKSSAETHHHACLVNSGSSKEELAADEESKEVVIEEYFSRK